MNRFKKFVVVIGAICSIGIAYAIYTLKDIPDAFDWEDND